MARKKLTDLTDPISVALREYEKLAAEVEAAWAEFDRKYWSDKTSNNLRKGVTMEQFNAAMNDISRLQMRAFGALDKWRHLVRHKDDPSTEPAVPEADVRAVIGASLSDKMDEMKFSLNFGLLASKVAQAIRMDVEEGDAGAAPLCVDHS